MATFAESLALVLMFLEQARGTATAMTREIIRSLTDQFLRDLPPIYGARWLLAGKNNEVEVDADRGRITLTVESSQGSKGSRERSEVVEEVFAHPCTCDSHCFC